MFLFWGHFQGQIWEHFRGHLGDIQQPRGPNFDSLASTPGVDKHGHFIYYYHVTPQGLPTDPLPPLFVHVVIDAVKKKLLLDIPPPPPLPP